MVERVQCNDTTLQAVSELFDFRHLVLESLLHPVETFNTSNPFSIFTMPQFSVSDIPDLAGKVILVTGGMFDHRKTPAPFS